MPNGKVRLQNYILDKAEFLCRKVLRVMAEETEEKKINTERIQTKMLTVVFLWLVGS